MLSSFFKILSTPCTQCGARIHNPHQDRALHGLAGQRPTRGHLRGARACIQEAQGKRVGEMLREEDSGHPVGLCFVMCVIPVKSKHLCYMLGFLFSLYSFHSRNVALPSNSSEQHNAGVKAAGEERGGQQAPRELPLGEGSRVP